MFCKIWKKLKQRKRVRIDVTRKHYNIMKKKTEALIKRMKIENTVYTSEEVNCRLKFMNNENMGEASFDNLEDVDLFLTQT